MNKKKYNSDNFIMTNNLDYCIMMTKLMRRNITYIKNESNLLIKKRKQIPKIVKLPIIDNY